MPSVVSTQEDRFGFSVLEYVWDRVWNGPAMVIGFKETAVTVAEIVQPDLSFGRVARRRPEDVCRYVKIIMPEEEAETAETALRASIPTFVISPESLEMMKDEAKTDRQAAYEVEEIEAEQQHREEMLISATKRIHDARVRRGLVDAR